MYIEFLVEEPSTEAALYNLVPKIIGDAVDFVVHPYQGKRDLLAKLPQRLKGYRAWLPEDGRIVVLVDRDENDCHALKAQLEEMARADGLTTRAVVGDGAQFQVLNRLAIEELEAWFFGDIDALRAAYPRLPARLAQRAKYRNPDAIAGGTWEALERELQRAGYFLGGLQKIAAAREISIHMQPDRTSSHSFHVFQQGLLALIG
jgi:hypothetical protein